MWLISWTISSLTAALSVVRSRLLTIAEPSRRQDGATPTLTSSSAAAVSAPPSPAPKLAPTPPEHPTNGPELLFPFAPSTDTSFLQISIPEHSAHFQSDFINERDSPHSQAREPASRTPASPATTCPAKSSFQSLRSQTFNSNALGLSSSSQISSLHLSSKPQPSTPATMPAQEDLTRTASTLTALLRKSSATSPEINKALSIAKKVLLTHNLLLPNPAAPPPAHAAARYILETSSLLSIRAQDPDAFTRYFSALQPFYELPRDAYPKGEDRGQKSKVTGLYLMLLLTKGDYAGFHTLLEGLEAEEGDKGEMDLDKEIRYPVMLERWLMEGSYDRVWETTKGDNLPSAEFGIFSQVLMRTIQEEIASCSERAYPSIPVANAKNLLFQDSEGAVIKFAQERGWVVKDGRIYFPEQGQELRNEKEILVSSGQVIENTIGYARELETIV